MRKRRKNQILTIFMLIIAIAGLSVGFAAFSSTLDISSSAMITPNSSSFDIVFSSANDSITTNSQTGIIVNGTGTNGAQGGITGLYRNAATGLTATFTEPDQSLIVQLYAHNIGEYDAYLKAVNISNINGNKYKRCTASSDATPQLVQNACNGITIITKVGDKYYDYGEKIRNHRLLKGTVEPITIQIIYYSNSERADGDFDIEFGDITLEYSTMDNPKNIINFLIEGEAQAEEGMTLGEWINSEYNTLGVKIDNNGAIVTSDCIKLSSVDGNIYTDMIITEGMDIYVRAYGSPSRYGSCS